jgi:hypothetical protein
MNTVIKASISLFFLLGTGCGQNKEFPSTATIALDAIGSMQWLEGKWLQETDSGRIWETWEKMNDSTYLTRHWFIHAADSILITEADISFTGSEVLLSIHQGANPDATPAYYPLVRSKNGEHVFEDMSRAFPQRIIYLLQPDGSLYIRKEGMLDEKPQYIESTYSKVR